jgi:hypothetical protein
LSEVVLVGFDPGGAGNFGWAVMSVSAAGMPAKLDTGLASDARQAVDAASRSMREAPVAAGIDAPLYWVPSGDRRSDFSIRRRICRAGGQGGTVSHVNSLRGACLVQGILAAREIALRWPGASVTEAHPKALPFVWPAIDAFFGKRLRLPMSNRERDAVVAAYAAWALAARFEGWSDLVEAEEEPFFPSGQRVQYWFPSGSA